MSSDTKIYLSNHAKTEEVFKVILKIVGHDFNQYSHQSGKHIKKSQPSSEENSWTVRFEKNQGNEIRYPKKDLSFDPYFNFIFKDSIGVEHSCMFFFEGYDNEYSCDNEKIMNPSSTPLWGAIGKRLVDFFGGKVLFCDSADSDNPDNWHVCDNPKYYPKTKDESSNDRYYRYQNALFNEPVISSHELKAMYDKTRYLDDDIRGLVSYMEKYESAQYLSKTLSEQIEQATTKKKMKVWYGHKYKNLFE